MIMPDIPSAMYPLWEVISEEPWPQDSSGIAHAGYVARFLLHFSQECSASCITLLEPQLDFGI